MESINRANGKPLFTGLNAFVAAAEYMSFDKAAKALCVTPSAVSCQIRFLESIVGRPLFNRIHNTVVLTPIGEWLYQKAQAPLNELYLISRQVKKVGSSDQISNGLDELV